MPHGRSALAATSCALIVVILIATFAFGGFWIGTQIDLNAVLPSTIRAAALVASTSTFIIGLALFLLGTPSSIRFVRCGFHDFPQFFAQNSPSFVLFAVSCAFAAITGYSPTPPKAEAPPSLGVLLSQQAAHDTILVPFFPIEGKNPSCNPDQTDFGDAAKMADIAMTLRRLVRSIRACSYDSDLPVVLDVRGFASSSEFHRCERLIDGHTDTSVSDHLNWQLAEARRQALIRFIKDTTGSSEETTGSAKGASSKVLIRPSADSPRWANPKAMQDARRFFDRKADGGYDYDKAGLTRRVEIELISKGSCEPK